VRAALKGPVGRRMGNLHAHKKKTLCLLDVCFNVCGRVRVVCVHAVCSGIPDYEESATFACVKKGKPLGEPCDEAISGFGALVCVWVFFLRIYFIFVCVCGCMYLRLYIYIYVCVCVWLYMYAYIYVYMCVYVCACVCAYIYVGVYVCVDQGGQ